MSICRLNNNIGKLGCIFLCSILKAICKNLKKKKQTQLSKFNTVIAGKAPRFVTQHFFLNSSNYRTKLSFEMNKFLHKVISYY